MILVQTLLMIYYQSPSAEPSKTKSKWRTGAAEHKVTKVKIGIYKFGSIGTTIRI